MVFNQCKEVCTNGGGEGEGGRKKEAMTPMESLMAGSVAGAMSVLVTYPLDLARAQLAVSKKEKVGEGGGGKGSVGFVQVLGRNYRQGVRERVVGIYVL